jgi:hypothetical protein
MYVVGVAALAGRRFDNLVPALITRVPVSYGEGGWAPLVVPVIDELANIVQHFKWIPGHSDKLVPLNEHLADTVKAALGDIVLSTTEFEELFDEFEVLLALAFASHDGRGGEWAPPGRFAWKNRSGGGPYRQLVAEAKTEGDGWGPFRAGLFKGSADELVAIAERYQQVLNQRMW